MSGWGSDDIAALEWAEPPLRWQRSLRWQAPERNWRRRLPALVIGVLCTALPIMMFDRAMRTELLKAGTLAPDVAIVVELLTAPEPASSPPVDEVAPAQPALRTASRERRPRPVEAPSAPSNNGTAEPALPQPAAPLQLFGRDGAIRVPESESSGQKAFGTPNGKPLAHETPMPYEETRFDRMMPSVRESLGAELVRKTTWTRTWDTRSGTRIQCVTSLVMAGLGICGWGVSPRATAEELRAMRADPPMSAPKPDDPP